MKPRTPIDEKTVKLSATDDVSRAIKLLEWARAKGFKIGPAVVVGSVSFQVEDMRQAKLEGGNVNRMDDDGDIYDGTEEPAEGTAG